MEVEGPAGRRNHSQYCKIFCENIAKYCKDIVKSSQNLEVEGSAGRRSHSQYCKIFCKNIAKYFKDIVKSLQNLEVEGRAGRRSHSQYWAHRGQLTSKHNGTRENGKTTN